MYVYIIFYLFIIIDCALLCIILGTVNWWYFIFQLEGLESKKVYYCMSGCLSLSRFPLHLLHYRLCCIAICALQFCVRSVYRMFVFRDPRSWSLETLCVKYIYTVPIKSIHLLWLLCLINFIHVLFRITLCPDKWQSSQLNT